MTITLPSEHSESVRSLAQIGLSEEEIATKFQLSPKKLRRLYKRELREGAAEGNIQVLEKLHQAASSGSNITATTLWVKARCGWRDTGVTAHSSNLIRSKLIVAMRESGPQQIQPEI